MKAAGELSGRNAPFHFGSRFAFFPYFTLDAFRFFCSYLLNPHRRSDSRFYTAYVPHDPLRARHGHERRHILNQPLTFRMFRCPNYRSLR